MLAEIVPHRRAGRAVEFDRSNLRGESMFAGETAVLFDLSEEQVLLREAVGRFAAERCDPLQRATHRATRQGYSLGNWAALAEIGLLSLPFSADDGGLDGGPVELITIMEVLGRALALEPVLEEIVIAGGLLARAGTASQKQKWLPEIMAGSAHLALAHIEQSARFELDDVQTRAIDGTNRIELHGEKSLVLSGQAADAYLVSARRNGDGRDSIGLYLVAMDASGLGRRAFRLADGSWASSLTLAGTPAEPLQGGYAALASVADAARVAAGAEMLGIMTWLHESTIEHVRNRKQFGVPLGSFQVIQHRLVDLFVSLELSRSHVYRAALCSDQERELAVAAMKAYLSSAAVTMGEQCMHLHGAMGTTDELAIGHAHKRLLVLAMLFGDADHELARYIRLIDTRERRDER